MSSQLKLFGVPQVVVEDVSRALRINYPILLLIYLAVKSDWVSRSELAYLFRPDDDEVIALKHIRLLLHRAKQYDWAGTLEINKQRAKFSIPTDLSIFRKAVKQRNWLEVVQVYKASFLGTYSSPNLPTYSAWIDIERADLANSYREGLQHYALELEAQQNFEGAAQVLGKLLKLEPLNEEVLKSYVKSLYLTKQKDKALKAYDDLCVLLQQEYKAEPLEDTQNLIRLIRNNENVGVGSSQQKIVLAATKIVTKLPQQSTPFVGREIELEELSNQLSNESCRLLTLIGLGGTGKTRLALELAKKEQGKFKDGVFFVALATLTNISSFTTNLAQVLGLTLAPSQDPKTQIIQFLAAKNILLILDNFEHLLDTAPILVDLIKGSEKLKLLITSRKRLNLKSEWLYDLEGLSYPELSKQAQSLSLGALKAYDAITLFIHSAKRVAPKLEFSENDLHHILSLVKKVGGLPLAIELAASWTRIMPVEQILSELNRGYDLLETDVVDMPNRHKSLKGVIDETFKQLNAKDQQVLVRLSVFQGGFSFDAAQHVAKASYRFLYSLTNLSLIKQVSSGQFDLHELIKQYLSEKLNLQADKEQVNQKHLHYYTLVAKKFEIDGENTSGQEALGLWFKEQANFIKALKWSLGHSTQDAMALLRPLSSLWSRKNMSIEADTWLSKANKLKKSLSLEDKSFLQTQLGGAALLKGETKRAEQLITDALKLSYTTNNQLFIVENLVNLGRLKTLVGLHKEAYEPLNKALVICDIIKDDFLKITLLDRLASLEENEQRFESAIRLKTQALELAQALDSKTELQRIMGNLGVSYFYAKDYDQAEMLWQECLTMHKSGISKSFGAGTLVNLGNIAEIKNDYPKAEKLMKQGLLVCLERSYTFFFFNMSTDLIRVWIKLGYFNKAIELLGFAQGLKKRHSYAYSFSQKPDKLFLDLETALGHAFQTRLLQSESRSEYEIKLLLNE